MGSFQSAISFKILEHFCLLLPSSFSSLAINRKKGKMRSMEGTKMMTRREKSVSFLMDGIQSFWYIFFPCLFIRLFSLFPLTAGLLNSSVSSSFLLSIPLFWNWTRDWGWNKYLCNFVFRHWHTRLLREMKHGKLMWRRRVPALIEILPFPRVGCTAKMRASFQDDFLPSDLTASFNDCDF